jgi:hypothetical protein
MELNSLILNLESKKKKKKITLLDICVSLSFMEIVSLLATTAYTIWITCVGVAYPSHALDMVPIRTLQVRVLTLFLVTWQHFIPMGDMASLFAGC